VGQSTTPAWHADSWGAMNDVSEAAVADAVNTLENLYGGVEGFRDARQWLIEATRVGTGSHLLELGCGTMPQLAETAARVGSDGRIVGLDNAESLLRVARERARTLGLAQVTFEQGDCRALTFDDARFDVVLADKLLIHVAPGETIVGEMLRVTRPGGHVGALEWDGEAIVIAAHDPRLTRRILDVNRDQRACFDAARRVAGWFARAGVTEIAVAGVLACVADSAHPLMQSLLRRWANRAIAAGAVGAQEAADWLADTLAPRRPGALLAIPIIVTAGRKPRGGPET
jgi:SAM-dependent methyltransferase